MPFKAPRLCPCGYATPAGARCKCEARADQERKARFDKTRPSSSERGYNRAWEKARAGFLKSHPFCRRCNAPASVVDHIKPHKGDSQAFWDKTNWQSLCGPCHNGAKQSEDRRNAKR